MRDAVSQFLTGLTANEKALGALGAMFLIGVAFGVYVLALWALPATVDAQGVAIEANTDWRKEHDREFTQLVCLLTRADTLDARGKIRECGL